MPAPEKKPALFTAFKAVSANDWAGKVQHDLKGENPAALLWHTYEGLSVKPCYHPEDLAQQPLATALPGKYPFVRGHKTGTNNWDNIQVIEVGDDASKAINKGSHALTQGADGLHLVIARPQAFDPVYFLEQIDITKYPVSFSLCERPAAFLENLYGNLKEHHLSPHGLRGFLHFDPAASDEKYTRKYYDELESVLELTKDSPDFYGITVNGARFASGGGTIVQEIAFTISAAVAGFDKLTNKGIQPETVARNMQFRLAVGTNYFFEIAKLRAIRLLWANIIKAYHLDTDLTAALRIHSQTSRWYQTTFEPHTNLLRATTEAMAAAIGGCDSLAVNPFDITIRSENEFSQRLARNLSLLLKEEAYLHQSIDPAAGSYYLETLTAQLAEEAWRLFQDLESRGGFAKAWQSNYITNALQEVAQKKFKNIAASKDILVGTNKFINPQENFDYDPEELIQSSYFDTTRSAYPFEVMRFAVELHYRKRQQKPKAIIASIGEAIQRHINASFAKEFFSCAGFQTEIQHFDSVAEAEAALHQVPANVIVMSASEPEYAAFARQFGPALKTHKDKPALILAANPQHMKQELKEQGFDEFLFQGCDTASIVARIQENLLPKD